MVFCSLLLPDQGIPPEARKLSPGVGRVRPERGLASASLGRGAPSVGVPEVLRLWILG